MKEVRRQLLTGARPGPVGEGGGLPRPGLQRALGVRPARPRCPGAGPVPRRAPPGRGGTHHSMLPESADAGGLEWKAPRPEVEGTTREDEEGGQARRVSIEEPTR